MDRTDEDTEIRPGDAIEVRDAHGDWHPKIARSEVFLNTQYLSSRVDPWLVVRVDHEGYDAPVNWPAADVRKVMP